jgi:hypothetical protein
MFCQAHLRNNLFLQYNIITNHRQDSVSVVGIPVPLKISDIRLV